MEPHAVRDAMTDRGVVRLDGAFDADAAARMAERVWGRVEHKLGARRDDRSTWPVGWLAINWKGLKNNRVFDPVFASPDVAAALDVIFEPAGYHSPKSGAQVLFSLPQTGPWALPDGWHMDCGFEQPTWPVPAVKLFAFFGEVGPFGGGTMLLPGIHQLVDRYRRTFDEPPAAGNEHWHRFLRHHPPLGDVLTAATSADGGRSMVGQSFDVDGVRIEVTELQGSPGDVVITHLHVFHASAPNTSDAPRQMLGKLITAR